ncbi:MAG TPA: hypothetical protein VH916_10950 [Dehalococcoidia bacterium]
MAAEQVQGPVYLVYGENGARLFYAGEDGAAREAVCSELEARSAGYVSGYQFVGRQRYELRCYLDAPPSDRFLALRARRELFDFGWHPRSNTRRHDPVDAPAAGAGE